MRTTIELGEAGPFNWNVLREEGHFLYRRVGDQDRAVLAIGRHATINGPTFDTAGRVNDWVFGTLRYEWKDVLFDGRGVDRDHCDWFVPRYVVEWKGGSMSIHAFDEDLEQAKTWVRSAFASHTPSVQRIMPTWSQKTSRTEYISKVEHLLAHIQRGDIYEVNYCTTRSAKAEDFDPFAAFETLLERSQAPFAAFHRNRSQFALCASPERFLAFDGRQVIGQPMKGTRPRNTDPDLDRRAAEELAADPKERSENIMALDVMRHDLSRIAASRSVVVKELCVVRSYPRVHQMVSTVAAGMRSGLTPVDVLRATFPMASMTGAPKRRAMQLIEEAEAGSRGLFSGSMGFFAPDGTGDFNVVIRTVLFDAARGELSLTTGSAITAQCDPASEYEECQVKARSVMDALSHA